MKVGAHVPRWVAMLAGAMCLAVLPAWGQGMNCGGPAEPPCPQAQYGVAPPIHLPPAMAYHQKQERAALRQRKLKEATAKLFLLAQQLRVTVGKTDKNTLSLAVIKKAKAIEKLAKQIQEIMARGTD